MRRLVWRTAVIAVSIAWLPLSPVLAQDSGSPWQFRLRGIAIVPDEEATISDIGGDVDIDPAYVPELDITYFLTDQFSLELILATAPHDVKAVDTDAGDVDLGSVWLLPPTLTVQYHPAPTAQIRPYVGVGGNLTFFYNVDLPGPTVTEADYDTAFGFALQAGVDVPLGDAGWFLNVDGKKIFLGTDVSLNGGDITADVDINPWVIGVGVGKRLGT
jgi:outer membrane protein